MRRLEKPREDSSPPQLRTPSTHPRLAGPARNLQPLWSRGRRQHMRTPIRVSVLAVCALLVGSANVAAQIQGRPAPPRNGVCFYDDINFGGDYFCVDANATNGLLEMNDR